MTSIHSSEAVTLSRASYVTTDGGPRFPAIPSPTAGQGSQAPNLSALHHYRTMGLVASADTYLEPPRTFRVANAPPAVLRGSVGPSGTNRISDVRRVQERLAELGFPVWADGLYGPNTAHGLAMFRAIVEGREQLAPFRLRPGTTLERVLFSDQAPRWQQLPRRGTGFILTDSDDYGWGTNTAAAVMARAGVRYMTEFRQHHPDRALIGVNDISRRDGSVIVHRGSPEHETHRTGLDIDVRLPRRPGSDRRWGTKTNWRSYDREATYAMIRAFALDSAVERILFADRVLIGRASREQQPWAHKLIYDRGHNDHFHVDVEKPDVGTTNPSHRASGGSQVAA